MKKILYVSLFVLLFICASCEMGGSSSKKLTINFYDGNTLIESKEYSDEVSLINYSKEDYEFLGWFLDKDFNEHYDSEKIDEYFELKSLNLYAKMELVMKDFNILIQGKINENEVVLNPVFTWSRFNGDSSYNISLLLNKEEVASLNTTKNYFQYNELLEENGEYEFIVKGSESQYESKVSFKTLSDYSNSINSIKLANPYSDGMVIQRNQDAVISGIGPVHQTIILEVAGDLYYSVSDEEGNFDVVVSARPASFEGVSINLSNGFGVSAALSDVLFGDVYLFAGQSNMQWPTKSSDYTATDIEKMNKSYLRFFAQDVVTSSVKLEEVKNGRWFVPTEANVQNFSAIATMSGALMGSLLKADAPIGIITAYQGNTNIADWMGEEYYFGTCSTKNIHYNAMIYPLRHTKLTGVVWYQGCNNSAAGCEYKDYLLALFDNYRDLFNTENLPFFVIGLACYDGDSGNNFDFSYVRESQAMACAEDDNAYFISTCDDGDPTYIHPSTKHYICERITKSICAAIYGRNYYTEGPSYKSHSVNGRVVTIELNNSEGLYAEGDIKGLYLAGSDGKYHEASVQIANNKLVATSSKVDNPVYIKYGFGKSPFVNIFNKDNFAITPFRTDSYNTNIDLFDYDSIEDYHFHPDGSKMTLALNNGNLKITKTNDGLGYGSVRLDKWGAVAYQPEGFEFTIIGTNSGASIGMRFIEGDSSEIWGYKIKDDFVGEKTFTISVGDLYVMYNKQNNIFSPQKISYVEIMVEAPGAATFELKGARFIPMERTKPMNFLISNVSENEENVSITLSNALFGETYQLDITTKGSAIPVFSQTQLDTAFVISKELLQKGVPYYIKAIASNELGQTEAANSGYVFYLKDESKVIVCNFDFTTQEALTAYMESSMSVHAGLTCELVDDGVKIISGGQGWQQFIFKLDSGAGSGMSKLQFEADFSNYKGTLILQLCDTSWNTYSYTLDFSSNQSGTYVIDFSSFVKGSSPFTTQTLMWVMFNFNDSTGNGYILLDDVCLLK